MVKMRFNTPFDSESFQKHSSDKSLLLWWSTCVKKFKTDCNRKKYIIETCSPSAFFHPLQQPVCVLSAAKKREENVFSIRDLILTFLLTIRTSKVKKADDPGRLESRWLLGMTSDGQPLRHVPDLHLFAGASIFGHPPISIATKGNSRFWSFSFAVTEITSLRYPWGALIDSEGGEGIILEFEDKKENLSPGQNYVFFIQGGRTEMNLTICGRIRKGLKS
ncbi:hypothetical protein NPIL_32691 [Nephila pilipes]|uniref:Uncharacterized protein n=1 Tax=Nephila pilipes TaxID=299642 RepID=A0A8X6N9G9_NEPPI|nr:hypothetical protein NPIL_32691 [Nephila pilipes]